MIKVTRDDLLSFPIIIRFNPSQSQKLTVKAAIELREKLNTVLDIPIDHFLKSELSKMKASKSYAIKCARKSGIWTKDGKLKKQFNH
jgi:hypothetical protein